LSLLFISFASKVLQSYETMLYSRYQRYNGLKNNKLVSKVGEIGLILTSDS